MSSKNITFGMMPIRDPEMISITSAPEAPPPRIRILDSRSREVETVRIGDKLTFRIEIPEDSKYASNKFICLGKKIEGTSITFNNDNDSVQFARIHINILQLLTAFSLAVA